MKGGKLLSEGGFGCVYYPSIDCDGKEKKEDGKMISKIQRYNESSKNEINIGKQIQKIPNFKSFFAPIKSHCDAVNISQFKDEITDSCEMFQKENVKNKYVISYSYFVKGQSFFNYITSNNDDKKLSMSIIQSYNHLLDALDILGSHDIVHYDLKGENIMYSVERNIPIIIDFGLSFDVKNIKEENMKKFFYVYGPDYYLWAPEAHFLSYLAKSKAPASMETIQTIVNDIVRENKVMNLMFSREFMDEYQESMIEFYSQFADIPVNEVLQYFMKYYKTWDNFSLSILYLRVLFYLNKDGFMDNHFVIFFSQLLLQNIHYNPERRFSCPQSKRIFNDYFYKLTMDKKSDFDFIVNSLQHHKSFMKEEATKDEMDLDEALTKRTSTTLPEE